MPFLLQIWMFTVPVVYSLQSVPVSFRSWYLLDPVAGLIEGFRQVVIHGATPDFRTLSLDSGITITALMLAYAFFKSSETTMADVI
jgi:lipopolysaccharide transport system permease protein